MAPPWKHTLFMNVWEDGTSKTGEVEFAPEDEDDLDYSLASSLRQSTLPFYSIFLSSIYEIYLAAHFYSILVAQ